MPGVNIGHDAGPGYTDAGIDVNIFRSFINNIDKSEEILRSLSGLTFSVARSILAITMERLDKDRDSKIDNTIFTKDVD